MIGKAFEFIKDMFSLFIGIFFQMPTKRFDKLATKLNSSENPFDGHTAVVLEKVTMTSGIVNYNGTRWKATLQRGSAESAIKQGETVCVLKIEGNKIVVSSKKNG